MRTITEFEKKDIEWAFSLVRKTIDAVFENTEPFIGAVPEVFKQKKGVFVTLTIKNKLRGCMGFIKPLFPIWDALMKASKSAAFQDPRFPPLRRYELDKIEIEVSFLTKPKKIEVNNPKEYLEKINNKMGLILRKGFYAGVLLPQVWKEIPDKQDFLNALCEKAGLGWGSWLDKGVIIESFNVISYKEFKNNGKKIIKRIM